MTKEEKKFILSSNRGELKEYFLKSPQKLLKFLEEIRLENISEETVDIIHIFIFLIVAGEFYLKNDILMKYYVNYLKIKITMNMRI